MIRHAKVPNGKEQLVRADPVKTDHSSTEETHRSPWLMLLVHKTNKTFQNIKSSVLLRYFLKKTQQEKAIKIGIDARPVSYSQLTGIGVYLNSLLQALHELDQQNHYYLISNGVSVSK